MNELATIEQLVAKVPFVMDEDDLREAIRSLEELSDAARLYGSPRWDTDACPQPVMRLVLGAAARHMKNYDGFTTSRAGDEMVAWTDRKENAGSAVFTATEIAALKEYGGNLRSGFHSVNTFRANRHPRGDKVAGFVPTSTGSMMPYFADEVEPWP